jgi:Icc-related predicted phosphoesterase
MIVDCVADLHGHYPELEGGDLLIVAGDLTASDDPIQHQTFKAWLLGLDYRKKVVIGGNHDNYLEGDFPDSLWTMPGLTYLCDSGTTFEHFCSDDRNLLVGRSWKIWGSPWTKRFEGMNPNAMAFTVDTEEELAEKWLTCPNDVDIIVTHCPAYDILDETTEGIKTGSPSLLKLICEKKPILSIFGHIHEQGSKSIDLGFTLCVNASLVNERYEPKNKAVRIELDSKNKRKIRPD